MAELKMKVGFKYSEENLPELVKELSEKYFIEGGNEVIKNIDRGVEDEFNQMILDCFNNVSNNPVKFYIKDGELMGKFNWNEKEVTMHMYLYF